MRKKIFISLILTFLFMSQVFGVDRGSSTAEFLLLAPDARSIGLGEAFNAIADDVYACYWNPAGISQLEGVNLGYSHQFWFLDFNIDSFAFSYNLEKAGSIYGYFNYLWMRDLILGMNPDGTPSDELLGTRFYSINLGYASPFFIFNEIYDNFQVAVGASLKLISQLLAEYDSSGVALDIGVLCKNFFVENLNTALVVYNLGFNSSFIDQSEKLPLKFSFGTAYKRKILGDLYNVFLINPGISFSFANNYGKTLSMGSEFIYLNSIKKLSLVLRAGYLYPLESNFNIGLKTGFGINLAEISFDYAVSLYSEINQTHTISMKYHY